MKMLLDSQARQARQGLGPDVYSQVRRLLAALYPRRHVVERRDGLRYPYPFPIHLWCAAADGVSPSGEPLAALGKDLSERGLAFYHSRLLPHRRMIASFESAGGRRVAFLVALRWCRFAQGGRYESGGRFLRAVSCQSITGN
jgi:hypothetical protein